jgi:regulator of RNase E activity RraA
MSTERSDQMSTADLVDLHGESLQSIPLQLRSFGRRTRFAGRAVTVKCFEDNALLKSTLADCLMPRARCWSSTVVVHYAQRWWVT